MELISSSKNWVGDIDFNTYIPEFGDDANIQDALKMFFFGDISSGNIYSNPNSLYYHLVNLKSLVNNASGSLNTHVSTTSDTHGIGVGNSVVGTGTPQTLQNKTLTSPIINDPSFNSGGLSPVGSIMQFAGSTAPSGWLLCDGSAVGRITYSALFGVVGTTYGSGDNSTSFNLPNLKGKVVVGLDSTQTEFDTLAETGGSKITVAPHTHGLDHDHASFTSSPTAIDHTHNDDHRHSGGTGGQSASHSHGFTISRDGSNTHDHSDNTGAGSPSDSSGRGSGTLGGGTGDASVDHSHGFTTNLKSEQGHGSATGSMNSNTSHAHTIDVPALSGVSSGAASASATSGNLQPYIVLNYIIKY